MNKVYAYTYLGMGVIAGASGAVAASCGNRFAGLLVGVSIGNCALAAVYGLVRGRRRP